MHTTDDARWNAVVNRDSSATEKFFYGVMTTGIYCRPGCASRAPRRENVRFFGNAAEAEQAGLRPCKRCQPQQQTAPDQQAEAIARACALADSAEQPPSLEELAAAAGMSRFHFHRLFTECVGMTPKRYVQARRQERLRERLQQEDATVTNALFDAGYTSSSQFYAAAPAALGMTPSAYRAGGRGEQITFAAVETSLGWVLAAATARGLCAIDLGDDPTMLEQRLRERFPQADIHAAGEDFAETLAAVTTLIEQPERGIALPLELRGTAFQQQVWNALRTIPAGETISYAELAARIGRPGAARAVAGACAANTLAVAVPCHRVVRGDGDISGYRWGVARKRTLLEREAAQH